MVVHDFHFVGIAVVEPETDPPLAVDPDAVEAIPVTAESLESIPRRGPQIQKRTCVVDHPQLAECGSLNVRGQPVRGATMEKPLRVPATERPDHPLTIWRVTLCVKDWLRCDRRHFELSPLIRAGKGKDSEFSPDRRRRGGRGRSRPAGAGGGRGGRPGAP